MSKLHSVGLGGTEELMPHELSGGMARRVALARAFGPRPSLLLADEPTGNLDSVAGRQVMDLLEQMNAGGLTLLVVTHDPAVAARASRVLIMKDGRIVERARRDQGPGGDTRQLKAAKRYRHFEELVAAPDVDAVIFDFEPAIPASGGGRGPRGTDERLAGR